MEATHYKWKQEPYLKGGDTLVVEPVGSFGVYRVLRTHPIEPLLPVTVNIATDFTATVPALVDTGTPGKQKVKTTALDVPVGNIAQYWVIPKDPGVQFSIFQPAAQQRFANAAGSIRFSKGEIDFFIEHGWYSMIPQIWVIGNQTPPTIEAYSEDMDEATYDARLVFFGYNYPVEETGLKAAPATPHLSVRVGVTQN